MTTTRSVFIQGEHHVKLFTVDEDMRIPPPPYPSSLPPPPRQLLVASPTEAGKFPVLVLLHGYLLYNTFYSQLLRHIASHGFVVVAPQVYSVAGADATDDINFAAATINWLSDGLHHILPAGVRADLSKLTVAGHSRGGKAAFGLALGMATTTTTSSSTAATNPNISALIGIDPVDGMDKDNNTPPRVLTGESESFNLNMPVLVVGCGLSELKKNPLFPACAPKGVNHRNFFDECRSPACYFLARDYGHLDMLDDETRGLRGRLSYCLCKSGAEREPMRRFIGGLMVAFMRARLLGDTSDLDDIKDDPGTSPVVLSEVCFR